MTRVLVIGGSGFTGQRVLSVCPPGWRRFALVRSEQARQTVERLGATAIAGDLDTPSTLRPALEKAAPDAVICLASLGFGHGPGLVDQLVGWGRPRSVFTSTTAILTRLAPATKPVRLAAEQAVVASPLPATIVRPTMIYGRPGDRNVERLLRWLHRVPVVPAPRGEMGCQQPVHVDDLAATIVGAIDRPQSIGRTVDLPGPVPLSFIELVQQAGEAVGKTGRVLPIPTRPLRGAVALQERLLAAPRLKVEQIDRLVEDKSFDGGPAHSLLGHAPRPFADGARSEAGLLRLVP